MAMSESVDDNSPNLGQDLSPYSSPMNYLAHKYIDARERIRINQERDGIIRDEDAAEVGRIRLIMNAVKRKDYRDFRKEIESEIDELRKAEPNEGDLVKIEGLQKLLASISRSKII